MRDYLDQTQFSTEEPFLENPNAIPEEPKEYKPPVPFFKRRKTIIGLTFLLFLLGLGILYGYTLYVEWQRRIQLPPDVVEPSRPPLTFTELSQEAEALQRELRMADPVERIIILPPLDAGIRMEARPRR